MKTELTHLPSLLLGGVSYYGDPISTKGGWDSENEIGKTFSRYIQFITEHPERAFSAQKKMVYEIHIYGSETASKGYFEIFVGEAVNTAQLPIILSTKFIEACDYLKVTLSGNEIIGDWWQKLDTDILPQNAVKRRFTYIIQAYDERFKGMDQIEDSTLDAYIPVETI